MILVSWSKELSCFIYALSKGLISFDLFSNDFCLIVLSYCIKLSTLVSNDLFFYKFKWNLYLWKVSQLFVLIGMHDYDSLELSPVYGTLFRLILRFDSNLVEFLLDFQQLFVQLLVLSLLSLVLQFHRFLFRIYQWF